MKDIKQIRENFDLITEKEEKEDRKLSALVRAGLYDAKKLPALKRALDKSADKMTGQEKRMLLNLLDSLISQVTSDEQVYRKVKQNVHTMNEAKMDTYSKFDPRFKAGYPSDKDIPTVVILKRKAIRVYPDNQKVALYYSQALDKYVTIPFSDIQTGINEAVQPSQDDEKKKKTPQFKLKPKTGSAFNQGKEKRKRDREKEDEFQSVGTRARALRDRGLNLGGTAGTILHDIAHGKFKKKAPAKSAAPAPTPEPEKKEPVVAAKPEKKEPVVAAKSTEPKRTYRSRKATGPAKVKDKAATRRSARAALKRNPNATFMPKAVKQGDLTNLEESFINRLRMIKEAELKVKQRGPEDSPINRGGGFNPAQIPYGGMNPRRQGSGEISRSRTMSGSLRRAQSGTTLRNPLRQSPVKTMRRTVQDVKQDVTNRANQEYGKNVWKKQAAMKTSPDAKAPPAAKPVQSQDTNLKPATGTSVSGQPKSSNQTSTKVVPPNAAYKSVSVPKKTPPAVTPPNAAYKSVSVPKKTPPAVTPPNAAYKSVSVPKKTEVVPDTAPQTDLPPAAKPAPQKQSLPARAPASAPNAGQAPRSLENAAEKAAQRADQQRANREADKREQSRLSNQQQKAQKDKSKDKKGNKLRFGAALAAAAAGTVGAAVSPKFVKTATTKDSWALQQKDLPASQQRRMQQANRKALETTNESVLSTIKDMVDNDVREHTLMINEQEININNTVAKKIMLVYESVNGTNKKKMEQMLNESATSFNKVLTFALRQ